MFAQIGVQTGAHQGALLAPSNAILTQGEDNLAWLMVHGGAKRQTVVLGAREGDKVEVLGGLAEGNEIIVSPPPGPGRWRSAPGQ